MMMLIGGWNTIKQIEKVYELVKIFMKSLPKMGWT